MDTLTSRVNFTIDQHPYLHTIELLLVVLMIIVVIGIFVIRFWYKKDNTKTGETIRGLGFSIQTIQFLSVGLLMPSIVILALEGVVDKNVIGTLLGTFIGYVLSGIGEKSKKE